MNKFFFLSLVLFFSFSNLNAEIVKQIIINGNERVSNETIKIYGKIDLQKDYSEKDIDSILKNLYETNFFEDIKVSL